MDALAPAILFRKTNAFSSANVCARPARKNSPAKNSPNFPAARNNASSSPARLATKPDVLVLDEPTAGVDAAATHALLEFISQIHAERKLTILLVTHDLPLVRKHAQQIIWLHQGKVLHGTAAELLSRERMAEIFEMEIS